MNKTNQTSEETFFFNRGVKHCKDDILKTRLRTLIFAKGMNEPDFYHSIGLSKQYWYELSWGIWDIPVEIKVKIAQALKVDSAIIFSDSIKKAEVIDEGVLNDPVALSNNKEVNEGEEDASD